MCKFSTSLPYTQRERKEGRTRKGNEIFLSMLEGGGEVWGGGGCLSLTSGEGRYPSPGACLWSLGIDYEESIPPAYVSLRAGRQIGLS